MHSTSPCQRAHAARNLACAILLTGFAGTTTAKPFTWDFELTGGRATQIYDSIGPLFTYFITPVARQEELLGEVRLDTISVIGPGSAVSRESYFDVEMFFFDRPASALPPGQRNNMVAGPRTRPPGATLHYVIRSTASGAQSFNATYDFETETGSGTPQLHLVKKATRGPIQTDAFGLHSQIYVWTAAAPTDITIDRFTVSLSGTIVRYQIMPLVSTGAMLIEPGDDAYNAREAFNGGTLTIRDTLTNRNGGILNNGGTIEILEEPTRTALVNRGTIDNFASGRIVNTGRVSNEQGATLYNSGTIDNNGSYPGLPDPSDPSLPPSRDPGFFNEGALEVLAGGKFNNNSGAYFRNTGGVSVALGAEFTNTGSFLHAAGTFTNLGKVKHWGGSFANRATFVNAGHFENGAVFDNTGTLDVTFRSGGPDSVFHNQGTLRNKVDYSLSPSASGFRGTVRIETLLKNDGVFENQGAVVVEGELRNNVRFTNTTPASGPDATLEITGALVNGTGAELHNHGLMHVAGGAVSNTGTVFNGDTLRLTSFGSLSGGVVHNSKLVDIEQDASITDVVLYRQDAAGAVTLVNGRLEGQRIEIAAGTLAGRDRVVTPELVIGPGAVLAPGNSPGTLTIDGNLFLNGTLELEVSPTGSDGLDVTGSVFFEQGTRVRFSFLDGYAPAAGQRFALDDYVRAAYGIYGLEFVAFEASGLPQGYAAAWDGSGFTVAAVPEPQTYALFGTGLGTLALIGAGRRRSDRRSLPRPRSTTG